MPSSRHERPAQGERRHVHPQPRGDEVIERYAGFFRQVISTSSDSGQFVENATSTSSSTASAASRSATPGTRATPTRRARSRPSRRFTWSPTRGTRRTSSIQRNRRGTAVASSAARRSSIRSSRLRCRPRGAPSVSVMPRRSRSAGGIEPCVMRAGMPISDSTPPRLSARLKSFVALRRRTSARRRPRSAQRQHAAEAAHLRARQACCGCAASRDSTRPSTSSRAAQKRGDGGARCARARASAARASSRRASRATHRTAPARRRPRSDGT
jgi:hypothetical protein